MKKYFILSISFLLSISSLIAQVEIISGGTSTAYTLTVPSSFALRNGIQVTFKAHTMCSASATMNVSGTGALSIRKDGNTNVLSAGDIQSGQIVTLAYDGANWQMMSPVGNAVSVPTTYWSPNGSDIYNNNIGNVGIGVVAPASKLDVSGDVNTTDVYKIDGETFLNNRSNSTLVGNTLNSTLSGQYNTFVGEGAGAGTTTPMRNTFMGRYAGNGNVTGADNTSLGAQAAWQSNSSYNTSVGAYSNSALTSGGFNTSLGYGAGQSNTTGVNNTIIGANANVDVNNLQYATAIGAGATVGQSYSLVLGGTGANALKVGIGTTTPAENLQISSTTNANISLIGSASGSNKLYFGSTAFAYFGAVEYNNNNNSMNFWTNNTPNRMYIDANGNVGINNASPGRRLDVIGDARISSLVGPGTVIADASGNLSVAAGSTITGTGTTNYLARWTPTVSQLGIGATYDDGTNVGIGTPVPAKASGANKYLTVSATDIGTTNASSSLEMVGNAGVVNTMASRVDFLGVTPISNAIYTRARIEARTGNGVTGHGQLVFYTFNGALNEAMRIRESGHIGIGGSGVVGSPLSVGTSNQFQVDASGNLIRINNVALSWPAANASGFLSNNGSGTLTWSTAGLLAGGTTNYVPKWSAANSLSSTSLIFDNGTTVGINTASPSASSKLHVVGAGNGSTLNVDDNGLTNGSVLYLASNSTAGTASNNSRMITIARSGANASASHTAYGLQSTITNTGTTSTNVAGYFSASGATNNYAIVVPSTGGRVGIGTTTPTHPLTVSSNSGGAVLQTINSFNTSGFASSLAFQKSRGTEAAPTAVASGDDLGYIDFYGYNSANASMQFAATISATAAQAFTTANYAGTNLVFSTAALNTNAPVERMTVYYNGAVGIGATGVPTTSMLEVLGDVEIPAANDYSYTTAKTNYASIPIASFIRHDETTVYSMVKNFTSAAPNYMYFTGGTAGSDAFATAGVTLPHGAVVTNVRAIAFNNTATTRYVELHRVTSGSSALMAQCPFTTNASIQTIDDNTIANATIDNSLYSYALRIVGDQNAGTNVRFYHVIITYTVLKAD